ncbi:MAG TPA: hypothetical protein PK020_15500 [Ilumatobacteraceae bacterium]|nr:hypothetical protein [Ilumatobacteraceae bacterium]
MSARIDARFELRIEPKWSVGGDEDHRILSDPIAIGCASTRPTEAYEFFRVLFEVQGLLSALFRGHTTADAGEAELDLDPLVPRHDRGSYPMWQGELMVTPDGVSRRADAHPPILNLADIGGVAGLARWVRLCRKHPRATEVALSPYRSGYSRAEVEILSLGSSFEYWVASHRDRQWAAKPNRGKGKGGTPDIALAMAGRAGDPFRKWVGQSDQWCRQFWSAYNGLKHDPRFAVDPYELSDLVMSARYLLTAVLLDRTANNRVPSSTMFASHLLAELGLRLRKRLE